MEEPAPAHPLIDSVPAWQVAASAIRAAERIAFDLEADGFHRYPERVSLLQVALPSDDILLIDPLALDDLGELGRALASPAVEVVAHSADYDLRSVDRDFGFRIRGLFDTSVAARFCGSHKTGLANVLFEHLGVEIDKPKHLQRFNWSKRPLPQSAIDYAAGDVVYLIELADRLKARLRGLGRLSWVKEECERLEEVRYNPPPPPHVAYLDLPGAKKLPGRSLAILRELFAFRDAEARRRRRPPYQMMSNRALLTLANNPGLSPSRVKGINRRLLRTSGDRLSAALKRGRRADPVVFEQRRHRNPWTPAARRRLSSLKRWRAGEAESLELDRGIVWPAVHLSRVALGSDKASRELDDADAPAVREWQWEVLGASLERHRREKLRDPV